MTRLATDSAYSLAAPALLSYLGVFDSKIRVIFFEASLQVPVVMDIPQLQYLFIVQQRVDLVPARYAALQRSSAIQVVGA